MSFLEEKELGAMGGGRLLHLFGGGLKKKNLNVRHLNMWGKKGLNFEAFIYLDWLL